jgi:hypothetical protein
MFRDNVYSISRSSTKRKPSGHILEFVVVAFASSPVDSTGRRCSVGRRLCVELYMLDYGIKEEEGVKGCNFEPFPKAFV